MTSLPNHKTGFARMFDGGAQLYYETAGEGPPLVLIHAGIADSRMWEGQLIAFADRFRVVRYDMRGFGKSEPVEGAFTHVADLSALLDFLEVKKAYLVGCSMGGALAMDFTLTYPERVAGLVMVASSPSGMPPVGDPADWADIMSAMEAGDTERLCELETHLWFDGKTRTPEQVDQRARALVYEMNKTVIQHAQKKLGEETPFEPTAYDRLEQIKPPVLVIYGDLDVEHTLKAAEIMAEKIPGARKELIGGTAHLPNLEQPVEFNRIVGEFLQARG